MTKKKVSNKRVAELLGWTADKNDFCNLVCYDPKNEKYHVDSDFHTDPSWTGHLIERYQLVTAEPYLDKLLASLSKWAYRLSPDGEMKLNEVIINALDALEGKWQSS